MARTKVVKSLGAVAVYEPLRVALLLGAIALALVGVGVGVGVGAGLAFGGDDDDVAAETETAATGSDSSESYDQGFAEGRAEGRDEARRERGSDSGSTRSSTVGTAYRRGANDVFGDTGDFRVGGAYAIRVERGRRGARFRVGVHVPLTEGREYRVCRDGRRICFTSAE
jgi:hypothetical protein